MWQSSVVSRIANESPICLELWLVGSSDVGPVKRLLKREMVRRVPQVRPSFGLTWAQPGPEGRHIKAHRFIGGNGPAKGR